MIDISTLSLGRQSALLYNSKDIFNEEVRFMYHFF